MTFKIVKPNFSFFQTFSKRHPSPIYLNLSALHRKKTSRLFLTLRFWQREKDSNPHKQSQSLSCYPYTIPLNRCPLARTGVIIAWHFELSSVFSFLFFEPPSPQFQHHTRRQQKDRCQVRQGHQGVKQVYQCPYLFAVPNTAQEHT